MERELWAGVIGGGIVLCHEGGVYIHEASISIAQGDTPKTEQRKLYCLQSGWEELQWKGDAIQDGRGLAANLRRASSLFWFCRGQGSSIIILRAIRGLFYFLFYRSSRRYQQPGSKCLSSGKKVRTASEAYVWSGY